jgi:putative hydrolase of the HAD superfamily
LTAEYQIDEKDYLAFVHDIPVQNYIQTDPALRQALIALPYRKVIFTNSDTNHVRRVLKAVGIEDLIDHIIDILMITPYCKPQQEAFEKALQFSPEKDPAQIVFFDDNLSNLDTARRLGFHTVKVGNPSNQSLDHPCIRELSDLLMLFNHTHPQGMGNAEGFI